MTHPTRKPIPRPEALPLIGQLGSIDQTNWMHSLTRLLLQHGPLIHLTLPGLPKAGRLILVGSYSLVNELSDDTRFDKRVHTDLETIRDFAGDGLFTAYTDEPNWHRAHTILMPAFGPLSIREMFSPMQAICEQMLTRWTHFGPDADFDVTDQMTRLTLDTIALCAFNYRFNSFYQTEMHPLVDAMVDALVIAGKGGRKHSVLYHAHNRRYAQAIATLNGIADDIICHRKADPHGDQNHDLLTRMLHGRDPETGEGLSDENIRHQLVTFLIAGHETTSGLLSLRLWS